MNPGDNYPQQQGPVLVPPQNQPVAPGAVSFLSYLMKFQKFCSNFAKKIFRWAINFLQMSYEF
jgi:hypothetical protein